MDNNNNLDDFVSEENKKSLPLILLVLIKKLRFLKYKNSKTTGNVR